MCPGLSELDYTRLISILSNPGELGYPVILPDFFVDHFVLIESLEKLVDGLKKLAEQGGGNLLDNEQFIRRGGNAVNTASALLALGLQPRLIVTTDEHGASLLKSLAHPKLDLSHVHIDGRMSSTVSLETEYKGRKVNLMISDSGSAREFSFSDLTENDIKTIQGCRLLALVNLNHNLKGSDLALDLFRMAKDNSNAITFMDMGDPSGNPNLVGKLIKGVVSEGLVDVFGLNENEVQWVALNLSDNSKRWKNIHLKPLDWLQAAQYISSETGIQVDLHTPFFTATIRDDKTAAIPTFVAESRVVCGAGDAWNAGDIYGTLLELFPEDRLILANAVASLYVSSTSASHPTSTQIVEYLDGNPPLSGDGTKLLKS
ncbi:MAG: carbohydrate kinase family protein [Candidatus Thorarchaeota archaeon]